MEAAIEFAKQQALQWTNQYGYHAVAPALLVDPGGVPWAWIFLLLLAEEAGKNVPLLLAYGFVVLSLCDHLLFWVAARGGPLLMRRIEAKRPKLHDSFQKAEAAVRDNAILAVVFGRFLPFIGRWIGIGAGLSGVSWARFAVLDAIGVALTVVGFGLAAHFIGRETIDSPWFHQMVLGAFIGGTVLTLGGCALGAWKKRRAASEFTISD